MPTSVLLVYPKTGEEKWRDTFVPPFSITALAHWLKNHTDSDVHVYDQRVEPESKFADLLRKCSEKPIIGFSTMTGPQIAYALDLARRAREQRPDGYIVFGGVHPTFTPEATVSDPLVDIVVRGEGEKTLEELVTSLGGGGLESLKKVDGLTFKLDGRVYNTPNRAPIPKSSFGETGFLWNYDLLERYVDVTDGERYFSFITSRGCPYRCAFCYNVAFWRMMWRGWSVERVMEEIRRLLDHVEFDVISFFDDNFFADPRRAIKIVRGLKDLGVTGWCSGGIRADQFDRRMAEVFKETNCRQVYIGAESASQRILDYLKKDIKVERILKAAELSREYGLHLYMSWMAGIPTQSKEEIFQTLSMIDRIKKIHPDSDHAVAIYLPLPGSELYSETINHGFSPPEKLSEWAKLTFFSGGAQTPLWIKTLWVCNYILNYRWQGKKKAYEILNIFKPIEKIRWRLRFFGFPIEGFLYEKNLFGLIR